MVVTPNTLHHKNLLVLEITQVPIMILVLKKTKVTMRQLMKIEVTMHLLITLVAILVSNQEEDYLDNLLLKRVKYQNCAKVRPVCTVESLAGVE